MEAIVAKQLNPAFEPAQAEADAEMGAATAHAHSERGGAEGGAKEGHGVAVCLFGKSFVCVCRKTSSIEGSKESMLSRTGRTRH